MPVPGRDSTVRLPPTGACRALSGGASSWSSSRRAWEAARAGHGQIVAVMGEAGIGKSRLFHEFKVPLQTQCPVLETFSVSHGKAYAYLPLIDLLRTYFHIALEDDERARREMMDFSEFAGVVGLEQRYADDARFKA